MLIHSFWLTSLLFIASVIAHAYPPMGLRPRYLSTGTGISLLFPTNIANGTASSTGTTYSPPSLSTAAPITTASLSSSAAPPTSTSSDFHLVAAGTGTYLDGYYLITNGARGIGHGDLQVMVFTPTSDLPPSQLLNIATFHLAPNGTLLSEYGGAGKAFGFPQDNYWFFNRNPILEPYETFDSVCEIVGGELKCVTGPNTVFYICVEVFLDGPFAGQPINDRDLIPLLGPEVNTACNGVELTLLVVPA